MGGYHCFPLLAAGKHLFSLAVPVMADIP